jgi:creatinine amidohydrolase/Fe(II)-dependent formamide hydrolase-like protein
MKTVVCLLLLLSAGGSASAQTRSLLIEDLTTDEIQASINAGMTTAIYFTGGAHQNGPGVVLGKHNVIAALLARRIAQELGNALVLPINPYAPAGDYIQKTGHMRFAGTISLTEGTYVAVSRDVVLSALASGFRQVVVMNEHGGARDALKQMAEELEREWAPKGAHIHFIPVYEEGERFFTEYLAKLGVATEFHTPIDDAAELTVVDASRYIRREKLAPQVSIHSTAAVGSAFIDAKVNAAVASIRAQVTR